MSRIVLRFHLGIDGAGDKHVLALALGATENAAVVKALLADLIERGLDPEVCRLFIVDGAKVAEPGRARHLRWLRADPALEGLDEMLTVIRLGLPDQLRRSLGCTNATESLIAVLRQVCRNVKRWRDARMALRWTATAMLEAEKSFRRLKAHKQLPILRAALLRHQQALRDDQPFGSKNLAA